MTMNERLKNYANTPDPEVWERIEKTMRRRVLRRQAWTAAAGVAVVALAVVGVILWPNGKNERTLQPALPDVVQVIPQEEAAIPLSPQEPVVTEISENQMAALTPKSKITVQTTESLPSQPTFQVQLESEPKQTVVVQQAALPASTNESVPEVAQVSATVTDEPQLDVESGMAAEPTKSQGKSSSTYGMDDTILWLPNVFVPSSDDAEINTFRARLNRPGEVLVNYRMTIFNRAGNQVFMSNDVNASWNGTYRGREMPQGAYVYVIYYTDKDGFRHQRRGTVTLVR